MRFCVDGGSTSSWTLARACSMRSTYTSDAISESRCGLHGSDRRHVNGNLDVAAWIKSVRGSQSVRGSLPITDGVHGGTLTHFTCAMHFQSLSSDDRDSTAFSRCAEFPSISNSETAGCRTACPKGPDHGAMRCGRGYPARGPSTRYCPLYLELRRRSAENDPQCTQMSARCRTEEAPGVRHLRAS